MDVEKARRASRWILPVWVVYSVLWVAWWSYRLTLAGGLETPSEAVTLIFSGLGWVVGLALGWQVRRSLRSHD